MSDQDEIQAPDIQAAPPPALDPSILSGPQPGPQVDTSVQQPPDVQAAGPSGTDISALTGQAPQPGAPQAAPQPVISGGPMPSQAPDPNATLPAPPQAAGVPSVWKNIAMGALFGAVGGAGQKTFSGGIAAGGAKVLEQAQQQKQNEVQQQQLQFESLKAADDHIRALDEHTRFDQLSDENKIDIKQKSAEYQSFLQDNFGITPNLSFNDTPEDARAAMQNAATANGGKIPPVTTVQQPAPDGTHGTIAGYSPSQQQLQQNQNGFRDAINTSRRIQGLPDIDDRTFQSLGFKGQRDAAQKAIELMKPTPAFNFDKNSGEYLPVVLAQRQQQLDSYQNHTDVNGNKDASPAVVKQLQAGIDYLKTAWDSGNKQTTDAESQNIVGTSGAKAAAARQEELAKEDTPQGRADLAKSQAEAAKANLELKTLATGNSTVSGPAYLQSLPPARAAQVQAIGEGRVATNSRSFGTAAGQALLADVTQAYPDFDQSKAESYFATRKDFTSGKTSTAINSYNTAIAHLGTMYDHVNGTNSIQINNPMSDVHRQLDLDKQLVSTELAKAVSNGQMTEGEKNQILGSISGLTVGSYETRIKEAVQLLNGKLGAYQTQWENGMPKGAVSPVKILSNESKQTIDKISGSSQSQGHVVGDVITQNGKSFKVTSVDANGKVTGAQ